MSVESQLSEFVRIVEAGSISAAARACAQPRASLSRRLATLESFYGVQLLRRDTHRQVLTEAGNELYRRARTIVSELEATRHAVSSLDATPRGLLRVGMPPESGVESALAREYLAQCPEVTLEFVASYTHEDLVSSRLDIALRAGPFGDENLIGRRLKAFDNFVYGSPGLIEELGPMSLERLSEAPCNLGFDHDARPIRAWPLWAGGTVAVQGRLRSNSMTTRVRGARAGIGLSFLSERIARPFVATGELVPVLPTVVGSETVARLIWFPTAYMAPRMRVFIDVATEVIGSLVRERDAEFTATSN